MVPRSNRLLLVGVCALMGCGATIESTDDGGEDAGFDAGGPDANAVDAGAMDAGLGERDGGGLDGGLQDAGPGDAGAADAGQPDAGSSPDAGPVDAGASLNCTTTYPTEAFRDDFDGASLDATKWDTVQQNAGGGVFTQLTKMLASNASVSNGALHLAVHRHCSDPYPNGAAVHPALCAGANFYSGAWLKAKNSYGTGKGLIRFLARVPTAQPGTFPGLWARNTQSSPNYGEFDLIEQWWDGATKGVMTDPRTFSSTTWLATGAEHTGGNGVGPVADVNGGFHVYEVEWDGTGTNALITYSWRFSPTSTPVVLKQVNSSSSGLSGVVSNAALKTILGFPFRPYLDFAVQPDTVYHVGPDTAATFDPGTLDVDAVVTCLP
jgi:hypothetical protein